MKRLTLILMLASTLVYGNSSFKLGVENISPELIKRLRSKRIGLIANQSSIDQNKIPTLHILKKHNLNVACLLAPEHGYTGLLDAGESVPDCVEEATKTPIYSLYSRGTGHLIDPKIMEKIDLIVFDIQDSGMRHFTYISHLYHVLLSAQKFNKPLLVFDRPNPLGALMEGPLVDSELISFISIAPVPLRHAMTVGELADYFNNHILVEKAALEVVPMHHYNRCSAPPLLTFISPGLRTDQACYNYSYLGLLGEIRPFGIGFRDNARFECFMLPKEEAAKVDWRSLTQQLAQWGINTEPHEYLSPRNQQPYVGIKLRIQDANKVQSFSTLMHVIDVMKDNGVQLNFSAAFDKAIGTKAYREYFEGKRTLSSFKKKVNQDLQTFYVKARPSFLYTPSPVPVFLK